MKNKLPLIILTFILLLGFVFRLYRFDGPIADWHSWRQADTSSVSRNFVEHGYDLLHPRFDDLSNIPSGRDNPEGYRFVEFPIYNVAQAGFFQLFGILTLEQWGRLVTIFSSVLSGLFLYLIVSRHSNKQLGLWSAFFYMFIPYNIYYGRTILPDPSMVMASLGGVYFFDRWLEFYSSSDRRESRSVRFSTSLHSARTIYFTLALLFTASAFLLKPYALFFTLPMVYLAVKRFGWGIVKQWQLWVFAIIAVAPLIWWRQWMTQYPEGIPSNAWLLNGNGIRFRPSFFRWIGYERVIKLILGYSGVLVFLFGLFRLVKLKEWMFFASFVVSSVVYIVVFATGNVQHDYYQILIMPTIAIMLAIGSYYLYRFNIVIPVSIRHPREHGDPVARSENVDSRLRGNDKKRLVVPFGKVVLAVSLAGLFWFGWGQVKDYFNINNRSIVIAGEAVDRIVPKDAKIIANYTGDTSFLYQTKRKGWPSFQYEMPKMIELGARYLVLVNPTEQDMGFAKEYKVVVKEKEYVIFELRAKP